MLDDHATAFRRRRDAADRLPPLHDGHRDPLDRPGYVMRTPPVAWLTEDRRRGLTLVTGRPRRTLHACIAQADLLEVAVWSDAGGGWVIPTDRIGDLAVALEWAGAIVRGRTRTAEGHDHAAPE